MRAKVFVLSLILATNLLAGVFALDWGGTLDNSTTVDYTFTDPDARLLQQDKFALWLVNQFSPTLKLTAQGSFMYRYENPKPAFPYLPDVDLLHLSGVFPLETQQGSLISYTVGRFIVNDFSGFVLADAVDGIKVGWTTWLANATLAVGYSGLRFDQASEINISWADYNNDDLFAPPRLIGLIGVEFPSVFRNQDFNATILMQQDFRSEDGLLEEGPAAEVTGQGGRLSTQYLGVGANGSLARSLYYRAFAYLGTGKSLSYIDGEYRYAWILSTLLGASLQYFNEDLAFSRATVRIMFASGDPDFTYSVIEGNREGLATVFVPVSNNDIALVFSPRLANLMLLETGYSIKPLRDMQMELKGLVFLRPTDGPVSDLRIDGDSAYLGSEIDAVARYRPFSDLGLALSLGLFFPAKGAFTAGERDPEFRGNLQISFAF